MFFCETWAGNELASELRLLFLAWLIPVSTQQCFVMKPGQEMNGLKTNAIWALVMQCHAYSRGVERAVQAEWTSRELFAAVKAG